MGLKHRRVIECGHTSSHGLAQSGPALPGRLSDHGRLGDGEYGPQPLGLASGGPRSAGPADPVLERIPGALAPGSEPVAPSAATGNPGVVLTAVPATDARANRPGWAGFTAICLVLAVLFLVGLNRVSIGQGEILGQACPPPISFQATRTHIKVQLYNQLADLAIPRLSWRDLSRAARPLGKYPASFGHWLRGSLANLKRRMESMPQPRTLELTPLKRVATPPRSPNADPPNIQRPSGSIRSSHRLE